MSIYKFSVLNCELYLNTLNGNISDIKEDISSNQFVVEKENYYKCFKPTAYSFCLNISDSCNLKCSYCFNLDKKNTLMSPTEAIKALDFFFNKFPNGEKYYVDLSGKGEPLLNKDTIKEVALFCHKKSDELKREVLPMLVCNGTLLSKDNVEFLQDLGVLFGVSIDGAKSTHDFYRKDKEGNGTFDIIINNVLAIKQREYIGVAATLTNKIFPLIDTIEYLSKIFNTLSFRLCRSSFYGLSDSSLEKWIIEYTKLAEKLKNDIDLSNVTIFKCLMNGDDLFGRYLCKMFSNSRTLNRCDGLITRFTYDLNGKFYGCPASSEIREFEVCPESISNYSNVELRRQVEQCRNCPFKLYCGGECKLETNYYGQINQNNCNFKIHLIKLAAFLKIYCLRNNLEMYQSLNEFCHEKKMRNVIDPELKKYCDANPNLSFTVAKRKFDQIKKRY